jgi:hypothetical protein
VVDLLELLVITVVADQVVVALVVVQVVLDLLVLVDQLVLLEVKQLVIHHKFQEYRNEYTN